MLTGIEQWEMAANRYLEPALRGMNELFRFYYCGTTPTTTLHCQSVW